MGCATAFALPATPTWMGNTRLRVLRVSDLSAKAYFLPYYIAVNAALLLLCVGIDTLVSKWNALETDFCLRLVKRAQKAGTAHT